MRQQNLVIYITANVRNFSSFKKFTFEYSKIEPQNRNPVGSSDMISGFVPVCIRRCHIGNWLTGRISLKCSPSWLCGALTNSGHISDGRPTWDQS